MGAQLHGFARYNVAEKMYFFPNGSVIELGYCASESDVGQYQGREYDVIFMDEATEFTETQFTKLLACLRGANDFPRRMYLTCNPGGVGHAWVKRLFITRQYKAGENPEDYTFIPARVYDNKTLMAKDPEYLENLEKLPDDLRRAWLDGDWDVFIGQYFGEWRRDVHVVEPFQVPEGWRRYIALDYGLDMLAAYDVAVDELGFAFVVAEVFEGRENGCGTGAGGLTVSEAADRVRWLAEGKKIDAYFAPPDLWNRNRDTGRSTAEAFAQMGVPLVKVDNSRVQGWLEMKEWLRADVVNGWPWPCKAGQAGDDGQMRAPRLRVFENCTNLIESIPALVYSERNPSDCATEPHIHTHGPDAVRYFISGRPLAAAGPAPVRDWDEPAEYEQQVDEFLDYGG
jgi:phage terminase large subunit